MSELSPSAEGGANFMAQAKLAQLSKQWGVAEAVLLAQGRLEEAIQMYTQAYKWEDAIKRDSFACVCFFISRSPMEQAQCR